MLLRTLLIGVAVLSLVLGTLLNLAFLVLTFGPLGVLGGLVFPAVDLVVPAVLWLAQDRPASALLTWAVPLATFGLAALTRRWNGA